MNHAFLKTTSIKARPLRELAIDPRFHPWEQPHISAASGLVCAFGRAYVVADDEHHIVVFHDEETPGELHRIAPGNLPAEKRARKRRKLDMETLLLLPSFPSRPESGLITLGSGSRRNRETGVFIPLSAEGEPSKRVRRFDLAALYRPLRAMLGEINIEGAFVIDDELLLLNRGVDGKSDNATARYRLQDLERLIGNAQSEVEPIELRQYELGTIDGVRLGFTDGAAASGGGWVFTAVAEDTKNSFADGSCAGSVVGLVDPSGGLVGMRTLLRHHRKWKVSTFTTLATAYSFAW